MGNFVNYAILVNSPPVARQGSYSAYEFCKAALSKGHQVKQVFFYQDGIYNANSLICMPQDEVNISQLWQELAQEHAVELIICVAAAQRRGVIDATEAKNYHKTSANLAKYFRVAGLGELIEASTTCDRFITFN
jgi:tRNA 2-thiouridine synthesizing protein D